MIEPIVLCRGRHEPQEERITIDFRLWRTASMIEVWAYYSYSFLLGHPAAPAVVVALLAVGQKRAIWTS